MTKHHPLSESATRSAVHVAHALARHRFPNRQDLLEKVGWTEGHLNALLQEPDIASFRDVATLLLACFDGPRGSQPTDVPEGSRPATPPPVLAGRAEVGTDRAVEPYKYPLSPEVDNVLEKRREGAAVTPPPSLAAGAEPSRDYTGDSIASAMGRVAAKESDLESSAHAFLGFVRWMERELVDAGVLPWDAVNDSYRQAERSHALHDRPKS